ncbi:MAG: hypothetical protein M3N37_00900 [Actinomycetota bacterium]|nr:hypothetical protein [Actinomycetota bacterium]
MRDTLAAEILAVYFRSRLGDASPGDLVEETLDYLIGLSGTRVEAHDLTHGVVVTDPLHHSPRLELRYSEDDLRPAPGRHLGHRRRHSRRRRCDGARPCRPALVVLKVSVDGDITILRDGTTVTTLLGHPAHGAGR